MSQRVPSSAQALAVTVTETLSDAQRAAWEASWRAARHPHPRQHHGFAAVEESKGRLALFAGAQRDGRLVATALLSVKPALPGRLFSGEAVCVGGPVFDDAEDGREFLAEIVRQMAALYVGRIRVSPYWIYPEAAAAEQVLRDLRFEPFAGTPLRSTGLLDLERGQDAVMASFSSSTRKDIRLAGRRGVDVRTITTQEDALTAFECICQHRRFRGLPPIARAEFDAMFVHVLREQDVGALIGAFKGPKILGVIAVLRSPQVAHPTLYSIDAEAARGVQNLSIGPAIWWGAALWAKDRGCTHLDVEGNVAPRDSSHPRFELENFKRRFSPEAVDRLGEHARVCHRSVWFLYRQKLVLSGISMRAAKWGRRVFGGGRRGLSRPRPVAPTPAPAAPASSSAAAAPEKGARAP